MNILIVEDNPQMRRMIRGLVAPFAGEIFECDCGGEAVSIYQKHLPDWVLMDICLTESDGIEATARIRVFDAQANILILTNYNDKNLRTAAKRAGAADYLVKDDLHKLSAILAAQAVSIA